MTEIERRLKDALLDPDQPLSVDVYDMDNAINEFVPEVLVDLWDNLSTETQFAVVLTTQLTSLYAGAAHQG